ncbi:MAG: hypothetical protein E7638_07880 [Ruminococcaceae bacterium]|nr:hypothetical protein [Oscillospiraceae bacterium]
MRKLFQKRTEISLRRDHPAALAASLIMAAAGFLRLWYFLSGEIDWFVLIVRLFLPCAAVVLFIAGNITGGERFKPFSIGAVALGVAFFIIKAQTDFSLLHRSLCTILYVTVLAVYTLTVLGYLPTKKLLIPLFGLPLLYHIVVEDTQYYFFANPPVPVWEWIPEISVLCIMGALFCQSFAMKQEKIG